VSFAYTSSGVRKLCPSCSRMNPGSLHCRWCKAAILTVNGEIRRSSEAEHASIFGKECES
jgi:hypothetical protein